MSLFPREHGAYGQMTFPLLTALAVAGVTPAAVLVVLAVVGAFLAHEPLLVLRGMRGVRARREQGRRAAVWLGVAGVTSVVAGLAAIALSPPAWRWTYLLPLIPAAWLVPAIASGREKTGRTEVAVALAFSLAAVPVSVAANAPPAVGFSIAIPFALLSVAATLAVRVIILRVRGGGNPRAARLTRLGACAVAVVGGAAVAAGVVGDALPLRVMAALAPGVMIALGVALFPPPPARLRTVGWTLIAASVLTTVVLIA